MSLVTLKGFEDQKKVRLTAQGLANAKLWISSGKSRATMTGFNPCSESSSVMDKPITKVLKIN